MILPRLGTAFREAADLAGPAGAIATLTHGPMARLAAASTPLQLVRSYAIPTDDPSYPQLLNWLWTYDSAMSAAVDDRAGPIARGYRRLTPGSAPVQSDRTATSVPYGTEYHVWPSAATGAWMLLATFRSALPLFQAVG